MSDHPQPKAASYSSPSEHVCLQEDSGLPHTPFLVLDLNTYCLTLHQQTTIQITNEVTHTFKTLCQHYLDKLATSTLPKSFCEYQNNLNVFTLQILIQHCRQYILGLTLQGPMKCRMFLCPRNVHYHSTLHLTDK